MNRVEARLQDNLAGVRARIAESAVRSGRAAEAIRLVAVTKYVDAPATRQLVELGCRDLGESRPQDLWRKAEALADLEVRWHMIGHLQRNKVARTLPLASLVHSCDSLRLAETLHAEALKQSLAPAAVLVEVNIAADAAKHGVATAEAEAALESMLALDGIKIRGLMCMAALDGGSDAARRDFAALRLLRDRLADRFGSRVALDELSMGMSGDFEIAIEEGATIVRVGSALFEGIAE